jgi:hypothetical protein
MTPTILSSKSFHAQRPRQGRGARQREQVGRTATCEALDGIELNRGASSRDASGRGTSNGVKSGRGPIGRYLDPAGHLRELVAPTGFAGSVLVIDRDATTLGDRRLVAHLAADEPAENARLVCGHYLSDPRRPRCRPVTHEDLERDPLGAAPPDRERASGSPSGMAFAPGDESAPGPRSEPVGHETTKLVSRDGHRLRLRPLTAGLTIPELRWCLHAPHGEAESPRPVSVREAIGCLESYEPVRTLTVAALVRHRDDPDISVAVLRAELERIDASRIVLNRGLRQAVLSAVQHPGLSMSEIALRCGRVKRDSRGNASGETTWLARRVGIVPEGGGSAPTPWIHSEVLALIARTGLGISPREVELG